MRESVVRVGVEERIPGKGQSSPWKRKRREREKLGDKYDEKLVVNHELSRSLVSFQSNKNTRFYRWLKYKEAFSHELVCYVLERFRPEKMNGSAPRVLDPFAGAGTTLTTATKAGWQAFGIELLPVGTAAMKARLLADKVDIGIFEKQLGRLRRRNFGEGERGAWKFPHLRITAGCFPRETEKALGKYESFLKSIRDEDVQYLFWFAGLSVLEEISYTRKDGQYLRWDTRSARKLKSNFDKGKILDFRSAIITKLLVIGDDLRERNGGTFAANVKIIEGSSLEKLSEFPSEHFDLVMTSPPYCNRYDYTRTYALELAFLGHGEEAIKELRQKLLSATVENKTKREELRRFYTGKGKGKIFEKMEKCFDGQNALHEVLEILKAARNRDELNNPNIPSMVENYFFEMNLVIWELARVLGSDGKIVMVNDNVQYHGEEVPVDLILSYFAEEAGLQVDAIWVLPRGKGNSSQQMDIHGRKELRKCVYVWSKPQGRGRINGSGNGFHA